VGGPSDRTAIADAALRLGHRRIAYIGGTTDIPTAAAQLAGFQEAIKDAGLAQGLGITELGPSSAAHGADALRRLMAAPESPTAIVTGSIQITRGALDAAHHDRLVVPPELSVVGFGDEPGFSWWGPGLTTVSLPMHDLATACGVWLLHGLAANAADSAQSAPYTSVSPGTFVERGSTAPPATLPANRQRKANGRRKR
jgi:DNA-binding LacI/PurR family transcriptional regulator